MVVDLTAVIAALAVVVAALVGGWVGRRNTKDTVEVDRFEAFTEAYKALAERVKTVEEKLDLVEKSLESERTEHQRTRGLLRVALKHIRDVVEWSAGDRHTTIPIPPPELMGQL